MAAPIEIYEAFTEELKAVFLRASPDLPVVRRRINEVFDAISMTSDTGDELDLWKIHQLAEDLGLELSLKLVVKNSSQVE